MGGWMDGREKGEFNGESRTLMSVVIGKFMLVADEKWTKKKDEKYGMGELTITFLSSPFSLLSLPWLPFVPYIPSLSLNLPTSSL